jgi:ribonuclease HI
MVAGNTDPAGLLRSGQAVRSQRLGSGRTLMLAGTDTLLAIADSADDGDIVSQAVLSALGSACGLPGLEILFPADGPDALRDNSLVLLSQTVTTLRRRELDRVINVSVNLHLAAWREVADQWREMAGMLASALQIPVDSVGLSVSDVPEGMDNNCAYAFAILFCQRRGSLSDPVRMDSKARTQTVSAGPAPAGQPVQTRLEVDQTEDILDDPTLPKRAREFEQAVRSGLHPLPRAATPEPGSTLYIYSDGASRGNPGKAATGFVVMDAAGMLVHEGGSRLEDCTNNQAEYLAIIEALSWVEGQLGHDYKLECRLDSELVVKQLRGEYKVRHEDLKPLSMKALNLLMFFTAFELRHVPRAENKRADALANEVLDRG